MKDGRARREEIVDELLRVYKPQLNHEWNVGLPPGMSKLAIEVIDLLRQERDTALGALKDVRGYLRHPEPGYAHAYRITDEAILSIDPSATV